MRSKGERSPSLLRLVAASQISPTFILISARKPPEIILDKTGRGCTLPLTIMLSSQRVSITESPPASPSLFPPFLPPDPLLSLQALALTRLFSPPREHRGVLSGVVAERYRPLSRKPRLCPGEHSGSCFHPSPGGSTPRIYAHVRTYSPSISAYKLHSRPATS